MMASKTGSPSNVGRFPQEEYLMSDAVTVDALTPWQELVYSLAGTWTEDFPILEEICAESGEDILRESF
jgi:hypothetical protein